MKDRNFGGWSRLLPALLASALALATGLSVAFGAGGVQDGAHMFSSGAISQASSRIQQVQQETGKTIDVVTVTSTNGDVSAAADAVFSQQRLNGVLLYISKDDRKLAVKVGVDTRQAISTQAEAQIRNTVTSSFAKGDYDGGLIAGVNAIGSDLEAAPRSSSGNTAATAAARTGINWTPILIILIVVIGIVMVLRAVGRMSSGYNNPPPTYGPGGYGQAGYGGPGWGGGWSGGGGGGFGRALLGGLAGAVLGDVAYNWFRDRDRSQPFYENSGSDFGGSQDQGWMGNDDGRVSDSPQDVGSWGDSSGGSDGGNWGDSGGSSDSGGGGSDVSSW